MPILANRLRRLALAVLLSALPTAALAQSCPNDLSSLTNQIRTPDLQAELSTSIDDLIANSGGLDQAIATLSQRLDRFSALQAHPGTADDDATKAYVKDAVTIVSAQLRALQCRKGS